MPGWIYVAAAVFGGGACLHSAWDAWLDLRALRAAGVTNGRQLIARADLRSQILSAVVFAAMGAPGMLVLFGLMAPGETRSLVIVWALVGGMVLLAVNSTLTRLAKRRQLRHFRPEPPSDPPPSG